MPCQERRTTKIMPMLRIPNRQNPHSNGIMRNFQFRKFLPVKSNLLVQKWTPGSFLSQRSIFSTSLSVPVLSCCRFFVIRPRFSGSAKESKMLQQNLDPHEDQDQSADKLCLRLVLHSEYITDLHADRRQDKCRTSDEVHCPDDVYM